MSVLILTQSYTENHRDSQRKNHHYLQAATSLVVRIGADWRNAGGRYTSYSLLLTRKYASLRRSTILIAVNAASIPLFPCIPPDRSMAC